MGKQIMVKKKSVKKGNKSLKAKSIKAVNSKEAAQNLPGAVSSPPNLSHQM